MVVGLEIVGVVLVSVAIIYSFIKKKDKVALALIIALLMLLFLLGYFNSMLPLKPLKLNI